MRTDREWVLYDRNAILKCLIGKAFEFRFAEWEPALRDFYE